MKRCESPIVVVGLPLCPTCHSADWTCHGKKLQSDGSVLRYAICAECNRKFRIIAEDDPDLRITIKNLYQKSISGPPAK
ncbi:MAG: hypothetical protein ACYC26_04395 [Phycisphaerales bacterium]